MSHIILGRECMCNGTCWPYTPYSEELKQQIIERLPAVRARFMEIYSKVNEHDEQVWYGDRCKDDSDIIHRMDSVRDQEALMKNGLDEAIYDALLDCASADYYYRFEKDWG